MTSISGAGLLLRGVMRKLGYILLIVGFLTILMQAGGRIKHAFGVAGREIEALPQQDLFTRKQVEDAIRHATLAARQSDLAAVLPGFVILCGGILLGIGKTKCKCDSNET